MKRYVFGIDVGGTTIKTGLFLTSGELLDKWEIPTRKEENGSHILDDIADMVAEKILTHKLDQENIVGIGIGLPGPVDANGIVNGCVNLGWGVTDVKKVLSEKTNLSVCVGNDANVAALGECWMGAASGVDNAVMVTLGTGVGGGVVLGGNILSGVHGAGGEIGHMNVDDSEEEACNCGNYGCLEQYVSATGIVRMTNKKFAETKLTSPLREMEEMTAKDVFDAAKAGDKLAKEIVKEAGDILGGALATIACVCDPEAFIIGGGVSKAGDILLDAIKYGYEKKAFHACKETKVVLATLGNDAGIYGSARMIVE